MKQIFLKILKVFLITTLILLSVLLVFGMVLGLDWPWWVGFFILFGLLGLGFGFTFFRKIWRRRREQRFVQQVIAQDDSYLNDLGNKDRERSRELQDRWVEAMDSLKKSHMKKFGNPLYVLPWYLVIGESGSGKTTAIKSARLSSPFAETIRTSGISGTKNCDWWFFEQAIIIDTAGRYAIPVDEGRDKEEWQKFLTLLAKYRKKEPINGLVVNVAADKLLESGAEVLESDGKSIRHRIDELMLVLGAKFPVYVLITKCDLVQGMTQFCDELPDKGLDQAMGITNHDLTTNVFAFQDRAMDLMGNRLRDLRLLLLHKHNTQGVDPGLLLFPEEFERLKAGLTAFSNGVFLENPYQETPMLRGIYFSSGRQEGSPYSHFLNALGLIEEKEVLPGTSRGLFLHDFFSRILPRDRRLFAPTHRALEWNRLTRNLGLTSWVALIIAICGLLSFSFVKNLRTLRYASHEFSKPPVLQGEVLADVMVMNRFRQASLRVEGQNRNWWIPRFGLKESIKAENQLKEQYCKQFKDDFLARLDQKMAARMTNLSVYTPDEVIGKHVVHLVRRINVLRNRLEGGSLETLMVKPSPPYNPLIPIGTQGILPEIREKFVDLYIYYILWRQDSSILRQEMNDLETWLKHILAMKGANLHWLVTWANGDPSLTPVELEDFWGGSAPLDQGAAIPPAFTRKGKGVIDSFIEEMESALPDPLVIAGGKLEFQPWYRRAYIEAWHDFGINFSGGAKRLKGREEWQQAEERIAAGQGPYFALLDRMIGELEFILGRGKDLPPWISLVYGLKAVRVQAAGGGVLRGKGTLAKVTERGKRLVGKLGKSTDQPAGKKTLENQLMAAGAFQEYKNALAKITPAVASRITSYRMAARVFSEDLAAGESPFFEAKRAFIKLKSYMGGGRSEDEVFWKLLSGPIDSLWAFVRMETACHLQNCWEKEVLVEIEGVYDQKSINQLLLGKDGYVTKFIKGHAAPFLGRSSRMKGYFAKKSLDGRIPFESTFLAFLTRGIQAAKPVKTNYPVTIKGLPIDTNRGARLKPHATRLELQCAGETKTMVNLNYPISKNFNWSPDACRDVIFQIKVGNLILTKRYTGYLGFPKFLKDFAGGKRIFYPPDFPKEEADLKRLKISYIKANYQFRGHKPVLRILAALPGRAPRKIVKCWDQ